MGAFKVETCYGDVMVHNVYDYDTGGSYYEVYGPNTYEEECGYGKYIGEFHSQYDYDDERALFVDDLENMLDDNDYDGVSSEPTPYTRQVDEIYLLIDNYTYDGDVQETIVTPCISKEVAIRELQDRYEWYLKESYLSNFVDNDGYVIDTELDEDYDSWDVAEDSVDVYISGKDTTLSLYIKKEQIKK